MEPLRILQVCKSLKFGGGIESWIMNLFRFNDTRCMQMDFCHIGEDPGEMSEELRDYGAEIFKCKLGFNYFSFPAKFASKIIDKSYNAVHVHCNDFSGPVIHGAKLSQIPVRVVHYHSTSPGHKNDLKRRIYVKPMQRWIKNEATNILACSSMTQKIMCPELYNRGDKRLETLYCGIDLDKFYYRYNKVDVRKEIGIPPDSVVIGHVGRFIKAKNHEAFLRIAGKISLNFPHAVFLLVGDGPLKKEIQKIPLEMGLSDRFFFLGHQNDIPRILAAMDLFLFPSLWEGFGIVITEAIAAGLPVVASDKVPAVSEMGINLLKELAFPLDDENIAIKNINRVLKNPIEITEKFRQHSEGLKHFDIMDNLRRLEGLYIKYESFG